ncbi:MAG: dihydropteroate synthase [Mariprofundus sp.]|nr:dihydropteroate synthase [Mariprofundus sp.]
MPSRWQRPVTNKEPGDVWMMGVLNCTPDSFSDGGSFFNPDAAIAHGLDMREQGAAIIDVGGESTRPGAAPVSQADELARVIPVISELSRQGCTVSVDSMKAAVMRQAVDAGASIINDVSALTHDADAMQVAAESGADICLMHMQGNPDTMQQRPEYGDVVQAVSDFFSRRIDACLQAGVQRSAIILDPGIGFGKRLQHNLALIRAVGRFKIRFDMPLLLGLSRKSFLGQLTGAPVVDREMETAVAGAMAIAYGADMLRVHDVAQQRRAIRVASALS